jgi:xanthine dehydrogenase large subunit
VRRGIALTPVKFGISFTATHYNQAGALLHVYSDGTVLLNHGGTEMGQGLFTKVRQVVAHELGIAPSRVRVSASDTSKVPNASPTAASSGSDLNGMAARDAARTLKARLATFAAHRFGGVAESVAFGGDEVRVGGDVVPFAALARAAYFARVPLSATGFYATPKIHYDRATLTGRPFLYFAYGAAVSEVAIDTLTGECRLVAVDILHDAGASLNPAVDRGQVEGGFLQGYGWLTMEALWWDDHGTLRTHSPSTYKIPTAREWPERFRVDFFDAPNREDTIFRSKAVGEPPFMLALSAFHAVRDALASLGDGRRAPPLDAPATAEAIFRAARATTAAPAGVEARGPAR